MTPAPAGDLTKEKVDELRLSETRKNLVIKRAHAELDRCRGQAPAKTPEPKTS